MTKKEKETLARFGVEVTTQASVAEYNKIGKLFVQKVKDNDNAFVKSKWVRRVMMGFALAANLYAAILLSVSFRMFTSGENNSISLGLLYLKDFMGFLAISVIMFQRSRKGPSQKSELHKWKRRVRTREFFLVFIPWSLIWLDTAWRRYYFASDYIIGTWAIMTSISFMIIFFIVVYISFKPILLFDDFWNGVALAGFILAPIGMLVVAIAYLVAIAPGYEFGAFGLIATLVFWILFGIRDVLRKKRPTFVQQQVIDMAFPVRLKEALEIRYDQLRQLQSQQAIRKEILSSPDSANKAMFEILLKLEQERQPNSSGFWWGVLSSVLSFVFLAVAGLIIEDIYGAFLREQVCLLLRIACSN